MSVNTGEYDTKHESAKEVDIEINMFSGCSFHLIVTDITFNLDGLYLLRILLNNENVVIDEVGPGF